MPDAPDIVLCSKLCRHNPTDPKNKNKKEFKGQKDPHPTKKSFPGHFTKGRLNRTPASLKRFLETKFTATLLLFNQRKISINKVSPYKRVTSSVLFRGFSFFFIISIIIIDGTIII